MQAVVARVSESCWVVISFPISPPLVRGVYRTCVVLQARAVSRETSLLPSLPKKLPHPSVRPRPLDYGEIKCAGATYVLSSKWVKCVRRQ